MCVYMYRYVHICMHLSIYIYIYEDILGVQNFINAINRLKVLFMMELKDKKEKIK